MARAGFDDWLDATVVVAVGRRRRGGGGGGRGQFMGLAAPHMSASADASEGVLETFSFQLELYYYHLYVMYHHMMKGTMSSPETVDDAAETMEARDIGDRGSEIGVDRDRVMNGSMT